MLTAELTATPIVQARPEERAPGMAFRLRYSPMLAQMVIIRRCNLACAYCTEFDKTSAPIPFAILEAQLHKLKKLGTFGVSFTGGEPTLHPDLPRLIRKSRELGFLRTGMITNGFLLKRKLIEELNDAGLQDMQISVDGVHGNDTTQKVLNNLRERLKLLRDFAKFRITVSGVIGACPPEETEEVVAFTREMGFIPRVLLFHDQHGQLKLNEQELQVFDRIVKQLPKSWTDFSGYRKRFVRNGSSPYKCRAGSRYIYVDEFGRVNWCAQTRQVWSKPLRDYTVDDLREQFYRYKSCHETCTIGCSRSTSAIDKWRRQATAVG